MIARRREGWVVIDTGSKGGTRLDGQPLEKRAPLKHGQSVSFGGFEFLFYDEAEEKLGTRY